MSKEYLLSVYDGGYEDYKWQKQIEKYKKENEHRNQNDDEGCNIFWTFHA